MVVREGLLGAARLAPSGSNPTFSMSRVRVPVVGQSAPASIIVGHLQIGGERGTRTLDLGIMRPKH